MSNAVFPVLPGMQFDRKRSPQFKNLVQTSVSGKETRIALWSYPRYIYSVSYDLLRSASAFGEWQTLIGFFLQRQGSYDSFLFDDSEDDAVTAQNFGTGDGSTKNFQLVRSLGGWNDVIQNLNGAASIYINGSLQSSGYTISSTGLVQFTSAPANNAALTWTGNYYWRCRFQADEVEFNLAMSKWWELKKLEWISIKQ